ncbi:MAG TPA: hypothetical protein PKB15_04920 [Acidimicrobiia bacterium]|nr:hypothetical protein [Acidimicrobiia bacterium]
MNVSRKTIPVHDMSHHERVETPPKEYGKLALVFLGIIIISGVLNLAIDGHGTFDGLSQLQSFASQFMGVFFLVFAGFKLVNLRSFVHGFAMYDIVAQRSRLYAYAYPFLQFGLGVAMFVFPSFAVTHFVAVVVSGVALAGVVLSLMNKQKIQCACLGNVIKMPLAIVSGIEDGIMFVLAMLMFFAMFG